MAATDVEDRFATGLSALVAGDWEEARQALEEVARTSDEPEALDGLGRRCGGCAILGAQSSIGSERMRASVGAAIWPRGSNRPLAFARVRARLGNGAAANGWLARAERLLSRVAPGSDQGWLELARARACDRPGRGGATRRSRHSPSQCRRVTRISSCTRSRSSGLPRSSDGRVDEGIARLDEAMAAVTGGEPRRLERSPMSAARCCWPCELRRRQRPAGAMDRGDGVVCAHV